MFFKPLRKKASFSAASAQLRSYRKASQKPAVLAPAEKPAFTQGCRKAGFYEAFTQLCGKAAEKSAFLQLLRNFYAELRKNSHDFYAELRKNSHDEQKLRKRSNYAGANTAGFCEAFACSFYADLCKSCVSTAFTQTCIKKLRKTCISTAFTQVCVKAA